MGKLLDFATNSEIRVRPALAKLSGPEKVLGEWEQPLVLAYLAFGYADASGDRSIDLFLRGHSRGLATDEIEALEALQKTAWPSLFEVQTVQVDVGLQLNDLVTGEDLFVREKAATHYAEKFDLMLCWVVQLKDRFEMTGACCSVPRAHREVVQKALAKELRGLRREQPETPDHVLLREAILAGQAAMRGAVANWRPPKIVTTDGDDMIFCQAVFDVTDLAFVRAQLGARPDMEEDEDGFVWIDRKGRREVAGGPLRIGTIRFERGRMKLETESRERLERGKKLLIDSLAHAVRHRMDSVKDLDVAMEEYARRPEREAADEISEEAQAQILGPIMQQHVDSWIDEPIPALKGKTPRQAVKTKAGRGKVAVMLKDQESSLQRQPGGELVDFSHVYRELGLSK